MPRSEELEAPEEKKSALSPEMVELLATMQQQNLQTTLAAVAELRRPSEEEQAKQDAAKERRLANVRAQMEDAREMEVGMKAVQASCSHSKANGLTAFVAQINSDGCYRAFCPVCRYVSPNIKAEEWQRTTEGLNMHKLKGLTIAMLEKMAANSPPPEKLRRVPLGMVPDLSNATF